MLEFVDVSLRRGARLLFAQASWQIHPGQKVGITGANGSGKSSLFALIRGSLQEDQGRVSLPSDWVIAHVAQEAPRADLSALAFTLAGDTRLVALEQQIESARGAGDGVAEARLLGEFEVAGGYTADSRAGQLLHGLGFSAEDRERPVNEFSGGWRVRLNLAQALMSRADLLLLDEPTNHLDLDAVLWLERWLQAFDGTVLLVSHDRDFLDGVTTNTLSIEQQRAELFKGNYSAFEQIRARRLAGQQAAYKKQQREIAHMRSFVERFRAKATKARQAQSRLKALERLELIAPAHVDSQFEFALATPPTLPAPLLRLERAACGYGGTTILDALELALTPGDRVGLLGPNGAGKSTLIKLFAGELAPSAGKRLPAKTLRVGYFAQHQVEQLDPHASPLEHLVRIDPEARELELRKFLGGFGFSNDRALSAVAPFSGGEKSRLALALLVYRKPNLLLLDEPTNHLDLEMRQALANALQDFAGAMVIVSHDRHLLRLTVDQLWLVTERRVAPFEDSLDDYPRWLAERERTLAPGTPARRGAHSAAAQRDRKRREAQDRQRIAPYRKKLQAAESELDNLTERQQALEQALAQPDLYEEQQKERLLALLAEQAENRAALARAEQAWIEAGEALQALGDD